MNKASVLIKRGLASGCSPLVIGLLTLSVSHTAYSLELPKVPLLLTTSIEPNVMMVLDDSGSMKFDWYFGDYNKDKNYGSCPYHRAIKGYWDSGNKYHLVTAKTNANGDAYFTYRGRNYVWGTDGGIDPKTGFQRSCFHHWDRYWVKYSKDFTNRDGDNDDTYAGKNSRQGNFWNYYFSNEDQTGGDNWGLEDQKFGVGERIEIAQDAAKILVREQQDIRIGLGGFNGGNGGRVLVHVDEIDQDHGAGKTQADVMVAQINQIRAGGTTPLGETLFDMGRYFVQGKEDQDIVLHPAAIPDVTNSTGTEQTLRASAVFNSEPKYEGATNGNRPSEPVIEEYCQNSYVVMLTDGRPYNDYDVSGYVRDYARDHNANPTSGNNNILDDVALALYDIDLRPDLEDAQGQAVRNNLTTYLITGFGLSPRQVFTNTAANGVGLGLDHEVAPEEAVLYQADDAEQLRQSFASIFQEIAEKEGSQSAVVFNSGSVEEGSALYQATYARVDHHWTGDLKAYGYHVNSGEFSTSASWSAADKLNQRVASSGHQDRLILTYSKFKDGITFTTDNWGYLSANQTRDLSGAGEGQSGRGDSYGQAVLNYLRGAGYDERFRDRTKYERDGTTVKSLGLLGDIVNSTPVEVGEPELGYPNYGTKARDGSTITSFGTLTETYSQFAKANENRPSVVYVGSNDGMLHAFDGHPTTGGKELFAYVPSLVFDGSDDERGLHYLTKENYKHQFYVDGSLIASDVYIDPTGGSDRDWRTIISGGLRAGGKGLYALDVTDPSAFNAANAEAMVLWEFGGDVAPAMGHIYGKVRFSMMNNGKWAAIVGNGYNSSSGEAKLFIIYVEQGADGSWDAGDWVELGTGVAGDNGLSAPVMADFNGDRIVDRIYAGDLKGNMWAFDVASDNDSEWGSAYGSSAHPEPLFIARDNQGRSQPITTQPSVILNPDMPIANNGRNALVYFGTGKLLELSDFANKDDMSFYAVWDRGDGNLTRDNLQERTMTDATLASNEGSTMPTRSITGSEIPWYNGIDDINNTLGKHGWRVDLPADGERLAVDPNISGGSVLFTTSVPISSKCANGGTGWLISLGWDGLSFTVPTVDIDGNGTVDEGDIGFVGANVAGGLPSGLAAIADPQSEAGCANGYQARQVANTNSAGEIIFTSVCTPSGATVGRMSWQDLKR